MSVPPRICVSRQPGSWLLELVGDHDVTTSGEIREHLREPVESDDDVIVDAAEATFLDSTALSEIVLARQRVDRSSHRRFVLVTPEGTAAASLLALIDPERRLFTRFESRAEALAWLREQPKEDRSGRVPSSGV
jgi:anti-anti-sigma regulatory factor